VVNKAANPTLASQAFDFTNTPHAFFMPGQPTDSPAVSTPLSPGTAPRGVGRPARSGRAPFGRWGQAAVTGPRSRGSGSGRRGGACRSGGRRTCSSRRGYARRPAG
jgi:hypothetical protein